MKKDLEAENNISSATNRREFLGNLGKSALAVTAASAIVPFISKITEVLGQRNEGNSFYRQRANACYQFRVNTAKTNNTPISQFFNRPNNGDETLYANKIGNFSKGLPHQANGEVVPSAYD